MYSAVVTLSMVYLQEVCGTEEEVGEWASRVQASRGTWRKTCESLYIDIDSTTFVDDSLRVRASTPTAEIRRIVIVDHWKGALKGLLFGAVAGGLVGWGSGLAAVRSGDVIRPTAGQMLLEGLIGGGCSGALFGLIGGYTETLEFMDSTSVVQQENIQTQPGRRQCIFPF